MIEVVKRSCGRSVVGRCAQSLDLIVEGQERVWFGTRRA